MKKQPATLSKPTVTCTLGSLCLIAVAVPTVLYSYYNNLQPHRYALLLIDNYLTGTFSRSNGRVESDFLFSSPEASCDNEHYFEYVRAGQCKVVMENVTFPPLPTRRLLDFRKVVLIVSLNKPHFEAIPKVQRLYNGLFQKIIYCVTDIAELAHYENGKYQQAINESIVEFLPFITDPTGESFYACVPIVLDVLSPVRKMVLRGETEGFLHISDDLIVNLWNYVEQPDLSLTSNWLLSPDQALYDIDHLTVCKGLVWNNTLDCDSLSGWSVLTQYQQQIIDALHEAGEKYPYFIHNLALASQGGRRVWNTYTDLFYVARNYLFRAADIFKIFAKHRVYMELAVGTVIRGITWKKSNIQFVSRNGQIYGSYYRDMPVIKTYHPGQMMYHPLKLGSIHSATADRQCLYCHLVDYFDDMRKNLTKDRK